MRGKKTHSVETPKRRIIRRGEAGAPKDCIAAGWQYGPRAGFSGAWSVRTHTFLHTGWT